MAGAVPHSTPILTDGALNLGESTLGLWVTGTTTFVMLLSLSTFSYFGNQWFDLPVFGEFGIIN
ncbi:hypothetical protein MH1LPH_12750 [Lactiplantibacillus brownii]